MNIDYFGTLSNDIIDEILKFMSLEDCQMMQKIHRGFFDAEFRKFRRMLIYQDLWHEEYHFTSRYLFSKINGDSKKWKLLAGKSLLKRYFWRNPQTPGCLFDMIDSKQYGLAELFLDLKYPVEYDPNYMRSGDTCISLLIKRKNIGTLSTDLIRKILMDDRIDASLPNDELLLLSCGTNQFDLFKISLVKRTREPTNRTISFAFNKLSIRRNNTKIFFCLISHCLDRKDHFDFNYEFFNSKFQNELDSGNYKSAASFFHKKKYFSHESN